MLSETPLIPLKIAEETRMEEMWPEWWERWKNGNKPTIPADWTKVGNLEGRIVENNNPPDALLKGQENAVAFHRAQAKIAQHEALDRLNETSSGGIDTSAWWPSSGFSTPESPSPTASA